MENGWGPTTLGYLAIEDDCVEAIIYSPFLKTDKFGRAADWTGNSQNQNGRYNKNEQRYQREREERYQRDFGQRQQNNNNNNKESGGQQQQQQRDNDRNNDRNNEKRDGDFINENNSGETTSMQSTGFNFYAADKEDDQSFSLVDTAKGGFSV